MQLVYVFDAGRVFFDEIRVYLQWITASFPSCSYSDKIAFFTLWLVYLSEANVVM